MSVRCTISLRDPRDEETCNDIAWALNRSESFVITSDGRRVVVLTGAGCVTLAIALCDDLGRVADVRST